MAALILNRNRDQKARLLGPGGECALCHATCPHGPADPRMVEVAFPAHTNYPEGPWVGRFLVVTLCRDCAIGLGEALSPAYAQMKRERDDLRREWRERMAEVRGEGGGDGE